MLMRGAFHAFSHLHVHDVGVSLHHAVAHVQGGLKADLRFLDGHHRFFQTHGGVFQLYFLLHTAGLVLGRADGLQCAFERVGETGGLGFLGAGGRTARNAGSRKRGGGAGDAEVHGSESGGQWGMRAIVGAVGRSIGAK